MRKLIPVVLFLAAIDILVISFAVVNSPSPRVSDGQVVPAPPWYDVSIIALLALVPMMLVVLMAVDSESFDLAGLSFLAIFLGSALVYWRLFNNIYENPYLQSDEWLWVVRLVMLVGHNASIMVIAHRIITRKRARQDVVKRLAILGGVLFALWVVVTIIHWIRA